MRESNMTPITFEKSELQSSRSATRPWRTLHISQVTQSKTILKTKSQTSPSPQPIPYFKSEMYKPDGFFPQGHWNCLNLLQSVTMPCERSQFQRCIDWLSSSMALKRFAFPTHTQALDICVVHVYLSAYLCARLGKSLSIIYFTIL